MSKRLTIYHRDLSARADDLAAHLHRGRSPNSELFVDTTPVVPPPPPTDESAALCILGAPHRYHDESLSEGAARWLDAGQPVLFAFDEGRGLPKYSDIAPESLLPINGFPIIQGNLKPLACELLRLVGLDVRERRLFLSYRRGSGEAAALQLRRELIDHGWDVFLDRYSIPPAVDFQEALFRDMDDRTLLLVMETPDTRNSRWVDDEIAFAHARGIGVWALEFPALVRAQSAGNLQSRFPPVRVRQLRQKDMVPKRRPRTSANDSGTRDLRLQERVALDVSLDLQTANTEAFRARHDELAASMYGAIDRRGGKLTPVAPGIFRSISKGPCGPSHLMLVTARRPTLSDVARIARTEDASHSNRWIVHCMAGADREYLEDLTYLAQRSDVRMVSILDFVLGATP